jgi:DNA-binding transcriptional LysR family regulator
MEFRYLVSFLTIAEELHFGRAAARLHLAQPSLSQQLQRLERDVGVELVARTSHEVRLTEAGTVFRAEAQRVLAQADRAVEMAKEAAAGRVGRVDIGFNYPGRGFLPPVLRKLKAEHPGITTRLWEKRSGPQLTALLAGEIDVAMIYGRPSDPKIMHRAVLSTPMVLVVGEHHRWAGRDQVAFRELADQPCLLFHREQSPYMHDLICSSAERAGVQLSVADEVDDSGATEVALTTEPVVAFASAAHHVGSTVRGMVTIPLIEPTPVLTSYVVWPVETRPVVRAFLDALEAVTTRHATAPAIVRTDRA